jgi:hypothetical protein
MAPDGINTATDNSNKENAAPALNNTPAPAPNASTSKAKGPLNGSKPTNLKASWKPEDDKLLVETLCD